MGCQDDVQQIRHNEVCMLRIGLMHISHTIYLYYLLLFVIHVLSLDKLRDLRMHLCLSLMRYITSEFFNKY